MLLIANTRSVKEAKELANKKFVCAYAKNTK